MNSQNTDLLFDSSQAFDIRPSAQTSLATAVALTAILFAIVLTTGTLKFESGDDPAMMRIAAGLTTQEPSEKLIFSNVVVGQLLKQLYSWDRSLDWYSIYLLASHFIATAAVVFALLRRRVDRISLCTALLLLAGFEARMLFEFQFTSTAMLAGIAGLLLLIPNSDRKPLRCPISTFAGSALVLLAAMIRWPALLFAGLIAAPFVAMQFWNNKQATAWKTACTRLIPLAMTILAAYGGVAYDRWTYERDPEWQRYRRVLQTRAELYDFPAIEFTPNAQFFFDRVGWTQNDFNMFRHYYLVDDELVNESSLRALQDRFGRVARTPTLAREHRQEYLWVHWPYLAIGGLNIVLAVAVARGARIRCAILALMTSAIVWGVFYYFSYYAKLAPRVTISAVYCASAVTFAAALAWRTMPEKRENASVPKGSTSLRWLHTAALFLFAGIYGRCIYDATCLNLELSDANLAKRNSFEHLVGRIAADLETSSQRPIFIVWGSEFPLSSTGPSLRIPDSATKLETIGIGWNAGSPHYVAQLRNAGIDNVYRALYERPDVYSFGSQFDVANMTSYVWEHFGEAIDSSPPRHYLYDQQGNFEPGYFRVRKFSKLDPGKASNASAREESSSR